MLWQIPAAAILAILDSTVTFDTPIMAYQGFAMSIRDIMGIIGSNNEVSHKPCCGTCRLCKLRFISYLIKQDHSYYYPAGDSRAEAVCVHVRKEIANLCRLLISLNHKTLTSNATDVLLALIIINMALMD